MPRVLTAAWLAFVIAWAASAHAQAPAQPSARGINDVVRAAFAAALNLDQDIALEEARRAVAMAPDSSRAHRALAGVLWIDVLFRRGAVSVDHYLGGISRSDRPRSGPADPSDSELRAEVAKAIQLATARLARDPKDIDARYDLGAAYGIQASYIATIEGSVTAAFGSARRAYDAQETVLDRDPNRVSAGTVVGSYRYAVSALGLPARMFAYMAGFGGGKELGIKLLEAAAAPSSESRTEAKMALVLIFSREGRHVEAMRLLRELEVLYPRNRLFVLEQGAAAIRAGRHGDAEVTLMRGLNALDSDPRPKSPGERALWRYKLGLARLGLGRPADAIVQFDAAFADKPADWVRGRLHLARAQAVDVSGRRPAALEEYRTAKRVCQAANDAWCTVRADRFLKTAFSLNPPPR
jgi:tetratricopeptide (TPR) repeat protein